MTTRTKSWSPRSYEDFQAPSRWVQEEGSDVLRITLPGFKKDQIKVQMDNLGKLRVTGERPLAGNRWTRFRNDFHIPTNCNTGEIYAKFDDGVLDIVMPRLVTKPVQPNKPPPSQDPMPGPKPDTRQESMRPVDAREKEKKSGIGIGANAGAFADGDPMGGESMKEDVRADDRDRSGPAKPEKPAASLSFKKPNQLLVNAAVGVVLLIGFSVYLTYRVTMAAKCKCN